jgi:hypothetical protein
MWYYKRSQTAQTVNIGYLYTGTNGHYRILICRSVKKHFSKIIFIPNQPDQFLYNDSEAREKVVQAKESGASAKESAS